LLWMKKKIFFIVMVFSGKRGTNLVRVGATFN
jgi:hypothetical protein